MSWNTYVRSHDKVVDAGLEALSATSGHNATGLQRLSERVSGVSDDTNLLLQHFAESGSEIADTPYINFGLDVAKQVSASLEAALADGRLTEAALWDERYRPVVGSNPALFTHPVQPVLIEAARPHQEAARAFRGFFGMSFTDRNCFGAVAMPERSLPQRPGDPKWNSEYSRAGVFFHFPETAVQVKITQPFCLKAYRRPLAGGGVVLLKQVIASISVDGAHWGVLQLAYENQG